MIKRKINSTSKPISSKQLNSYQLILNKAINILPYKEDPILLDMTLNVIATINQYHITELVGELLKLISVKYLRSLIVESLGFWLQVPSFKVQAYQLFLKDLDLEVKMTALMAWASYYYNSKNAIVLIKLYNILLDPIYPFSIRKVAFVNILHVSGCCYCISDLYLIAKSQPKSPKDFFEQINWQLITNIMQYFAPQALKIYPIIKNK